METESICIVREGKSQGQLIIDRVALAKQGDNALGGVRLSVCPSVTTHA